MITSIFGFPGLSCYLRLPRASLRHLLKNLKKRGPLKAKSCKKANLPRPIPIYIRPNQLTNAGITCFLLDNMEPLGKLCGYTGALHGLDGEFCKTPRVSRTVSRAQSPLT